MKLRSIIAGTLALALSASFALAQTNQGTSPLTGPKGGTNNAFMQFTGPATSIKTYTLPNASDTIATLTGAQTLTNKTFNCANNTCTVRIANDVSGLGTGVATWLGTPSSANLRSALTDETGTGAAVFATSPTLVTPALGTPSSGVLTNATGLPLSGLVAQAAYTFVGNNTGSSAVPTAVDIAALTTKASPAAGDYVMLSDQAASGAWKKAAVSSLASAGSVSSIAGNTGAFTLSNGITNSTNDIRIDPATQSDQETATSTVKPVTPGRQQYHPSAAKAWVQFTTTGSNGAQTVNASYNVSGVSRTSSGHYVVTFSTAFSSANYAVVAMSTGSFLVSNYEAQVAGSVGVVFATGVPAVADPTSATVVCFGDQ